MTRKAVNHPDLRFDGSKDDVERLNRMMQHIRTLTREVNRLQDMLDAGDPGQVLTKNSADDYDADWQDA